MPHLFISHTSDDKYRLSPYVDRLLSALADDVGLWIDTPEKISPRFSSHKRVDRIPSGDDWERSIGNAIDKASCVLGFWSANAVKRRHDKMWQEILRGIEDKKCLLVTLDRLDAYEDATPFASRQKYDVSDLDSPERAAVFNTLMDEIRALITRAEAKSRTTPRRVDIDPCQLPFLANRQPQISTICRLVDRTNEDATEKPADEAGRSRLLFIVPAQRFDACDMFGWRLTARDGPQYCDYNTEIDTPGWIRAVLSWPRGCVGEQIRDEFASANLPLIRNALSESYARQRRPICFETTVWHADIQSDFRRSIQAWINFWDLPLPKARGPLGQPNPSGLAPPIVVLLFLIFPESERRFWRFFGPQKSVMEQYCESLQSLCSEPTALNLQKRILRPLARLAPISLQDATDWYSRELDRPSLQMVGRKLVLKIYHDGNGSEIPLQKFADAISTSKEWTETVIRQYGTTRTSDENPT